MQDQCHVNRIEKVITPDELNQAEVITLWIKGMGCQTCASRVYNALISQSGVLDADIILKSGLAYVYVQRGSVSVENLLEAVELAGKSSNHEYSAVLTSR
jgi:copper chaperone CopZ